MYVLKNLLFYKKNLENLSFFDKNIQTYTFIIN